MQTTYAHASDEVTALEIEGKQISRELASEGIVLLENKGNVLPIQPCRIALFGAGAVMTIAGGTGSGEVNVRHTVNVREGLESAGFEIATAGRLDAYEKLWHEGRAAFIAEQRKRMMHPDPRTIGDLIAMEYRYPDDAPITQEEIDSLGTDTCVYVLARLSGEGVDRTDEPGSFRLTEQELQDIATCARCFESMIVVLNVGAPIDVTFYNSIEGIDALVLMGQLGMEGGHALADVLTGAVNPSGKLAVTWPESMAQVPFPNSFGMACEDLDEVNYREGIYVGYRYYTTFDVQPAYPFGYGLSYTQFACSCESISQVDNALHLQVNVRNSGHGCAGKHVVQVYAQCPGTARDTERIRLVAFGKTGLLAPGESETLELAFTLRDLASYSESGATTVVDPGSYVFYLGESSSSLKPAAVAHVADRIVIERHRNLCASNGRVCELKPSAIQADIDPALPAIDIDPSGLTTVVHAYGTADEQLPEVITLVEALSRRQLVDYCAGTGLMGNKTGFSVPGAVGHTSTALAKLGIPNVEFCDGPAGIRLQRRSVIDKNGNIKPLDPPLSIYELLPDALTRFMYGNPERDTVIYQFVTGFPTASSIAQTWNIPLAEQMGQTVAREMKRYGVTYWLAPAMNIVRNPLCGRNFEYFSEDPLVAGKMAASITRGVQATPGCFACVKHFAANNQETHRNTASSNVDERALREIYLRGFEIAVRESAPASIMAAYNKLNGTYCTESEQLLTSILRDEWGFTGVVMTDWLATGSGRADECAALEAGVDLIMPGGTTVKMRIGAGLGTGKLSLETLKRACARVLAKTLAARLN